MKTTAKRLGILMLAAVMLLTCIPLYEGTAYAEDGEIENEIVRLSDEEFEAEKKTAKEKSMKEEGIIDMDAPDEEEDEEDPLPSQPVQDADAGEKPVVSGKALRSLKLNGYDDTELFVYVDDEPDSTGHVNIYSANLTDSGYHFTEIRVGDEPEDILDEDKKEEMLCYELTGDDQNQFAKVLDMKYFDVGYHTVFVGISDGTEVRYAVVRKVPTYIYQKVDNSLSNYYTYQKKFEYRYTDSTYYDVSGEELTMFLDYKKKGSKNWSTYVYRMDSSYTTYELGGLRAGSTYYVRQMLGKTFTYDGEEYTFTGRMTGYASAVTIKTGYTRPKVKSIKITRGKNICHKYKVLYAYRYRYRVNKRTGARRLISVTPLYHVYRYWYTRFRVTVRFRKKQGIAGVHIYTLQGLNVTKKGNKKKYAQTFKCSGKKKGKKVVVSVLNWRSNTYGGYSKKLKKKVKVR